MHLDQEAGEGQPEAGPLPSSVRHGPAPTLDAQLGLEVLTQVEDRAGRVLFRGPAQLHRVQPDIEGLNEPLLRDGKEESSLGRGRQKARDKVQLDLMVNPVFNLSKEKLFFNMIYA